MKRTIFFCALIILQTQQVAGQEDTARYTLRLSMPIADLPQNLTLPYRYLSMNHSLMWGNNLYELGFWGIDALGNSLFKSTSKSLISQAFKYVAGLGFSKYGSELPIPLGVWTHEEFHRAVLGVNGVASKNGNWLLHRWDGTVYGVSDEDLSNIKENNLEGLLYAYVAGVQSEVLYTQYNVINDFYHKRAFYKNAFYLYNAYYVWNYFRFSTTAASDSVKILAPPHESKNPVERDFAGADLTAWVYDMFNPALPFTDRDNFPQGEGENRRIGFSDLSVEAQDYLIKQKHLSLLNFVNPAIFFINSINMSRNFSFTAFMQYVPTHFGNDIALVLPFKLKEKDYRVALHQYNNHEDRFWGIDLGWCHVLESEQQRVTLNMLLHTWVQPENQSFYDTQGQLGGALEFNADYKITNRISANITLIGKTEGWMIGSPYINENVSGRFGLNYNWSKQ